MWSRQEGARRRHDGQPGWQRGRQMLVVTLAMVTVAMAGSVRVSYADHVPIDVTLTVERILASGHEGLCGNPDLFVTGTVASQGFDNEDEGTQDDLEGSHDISPNWAFTGQASPGAESVPVQLSVWDEDEFACFGNERLDVTASTSDFVLDLTVDLAPCAVAGELTADCATTLYSAGTTSPQAEVWFRIEVSAPSTAPGLNIRCTHSPIWPQPGGTVTVTAEVLDGALAPMDADSLEIWVDDRSTPALTAPVASTETFTTGALASGDDLAYGCRAVDGTETVFSGWRTTRVGPPASGTAVPVLLSAPRASGIDIVFIADTVSSNTSVAPYTGPADPTFFTDVEDVIADGYYARGFMLANQKNLNFWISTQAGDAQDAESGCDHEAPDYSWMDAGAILHREATLTNGDAFRDCAPGGKRLFSTEPFNLGTVLHETGHRPFGLADEYPPDGGYFQADPFPNVYTEPEDCSADAPSLGRTTANCREWDETVDWWADFDWSSSEPQDDDGAEGNTGDDDLMWDRGPAQAADLRRINWLFGVCRAAGC